MRPVAGRANTAWLIVGVWCHVVWALLGRCAGGGLGYIGFFKLKTVVFRLLQLFVLKKALRQSDHAVYAIDSSHVGIALPDLPPRVFEFDSVFRPDCPQPLGRRNDFWEAPSGWCIPRCKTGGIPYRIIWYWDWDLVTEYLFARFDMEVSENVGFPKMIGLLL